MLNIALLASLAIVQATSPSPPAVQHLSRVLLDEDGALLARLQTMSFDLVDLDHAGTAVDLVATDEELRLLRASGIDYELIIEDLAGFYAARSAEDPGLTTQGGGAFGPGSYGAWLNPPFGQGSMGGYYTYNQMTSVLDQIAAAYPSLITQKVSIGQSIQGRNLWMLELSDNPGVAEGEPEVRIDSLHHAREPQGMHSALWFMLFLLEEYGNDPFATYIVDQRTICFIPCVNPDGYVYNQQTNPGGGGMWRKNRRQVTGSTYGVDLNRNYSYRWGWDDQGSSSNPGSETYRGSSAESEPEIQAMASFISSRNFRTALSMHTYGDYWIHSWGYTTNLAPDHADMLSLADWATEGTDFETGSAARVLYTANGVTNDYDYGVHDTWSYTPEIGNSNDGFWPSRSRIVPLAELTVLPQVRTALAAGAYVAQTSSLLTDAGDGDGYYEAGEQVHLSVHLHNHGRDNTGSAAVLSLAIPSVDATVLDGLHNFGIIASGADANNDANPLRLEIAAGTPAGTQIPLELTITYGAVSETWQASLVTGQAGYLFYDDNDGAQFGWVAGLPSDGAVTGLWERGNPVGTTYDSQLCNPEDDSTPGGGNTDCWITGNGGGSAGTDDVDGGPLTLISAPFDLSQVALPSVHYSLWYTNPSGPDDMLQVSISNDDGLSWTLLETVTGTQNHWEERSFLVSDYVAPSPEMLLRWVTGDEPNNSLLEVAVDDFHATSYDELPTLNVYGRDSLGATVQWNLTGEPGSAAILYGSRIAGHEPWAGVVGDLLLSSSNMFTLAQGTIGSDGLFSFQRGLPANPVLIGFTFYFQGLVAQGGLSYATNRDEIVLEP